MASFSVFPVFFLIFITSFIQSFIMPYGEKKIDIAKVSYISLLAMAQYTLTRLLYEKEEVKLSIVSSLLEGDEYEEVLFWTTELYESGFPRETWDTLWKIYYDFYAVKHPRLERFLLERSESEERFAYLDVVKNLYQKKSSGFVFLMRMGYQLITKPDVRYRGRPPKWLRVYPVKSYMLLRSISDRNFSNVCYYLRMWSEYMAKRNGDFSDSCYETLIKYFAAEEGIAIKRKKVAKRVWNAGYHDRVHILLALILHCLLKESSIVCDVRVEQSTEKEIHYAVWLDTIDLPSHYLLDSRRDFEVFDSFGCFDLPRYHVADVEKLLWFDWMYYSSKSPLWGERIKKYGGVVNEENKTVDFEDEDVEEEFHQDYGLEPDEQHINVQKMSTRYIEKRTWRDWFLSMFSEKQIIVSFDDDTVLTYG